MLAGHDKHVITSETIRLRTIEPSDQAEARALILTGLEEHWGYRDTSKNPDLEEICTSYADATFLVALESDRIIGTGALKTTGHRKGVAEIVRMSVAANRRRRGVGRLILRELLRRAECLGVRIVVLETTETWDDVIRFYLANGFTVTHHANGDVYFALRIGDGEPGIERAG